jgi:hypothetical protein
MPTWTAPATLVVNAITQNAGQTCSAGSRLLVQASIYDRFMAMVAERFAASSAGTPQMDRDCGPLIMSRRNPRHAGPRRRAPPARHRAAAAVALAVLPAATRPQRDRALTATPRRGGFLPPVPLPRRMWAGGRLTWDAQPLRVGDAVQRTNRASNR